MMIVITINVTFMITRVKWWFVTPVKVPDF